MSERTARNESLPRALLIAVLAMTLVVLGLGGAVLAVKLRPTTLPTTSTERAVRSWEQAVTADPKSADARIGYGMALRDAGRTEDARKAFEQALALDDQNWMALFQLGLLSMKDDPTNALDLLSRAARYAPQTAKAAPLVAAGDLLVEQGDAESASTAYRRAIANAPYVFDAHLGLARALEALGDDAGALKEYREAARFDPSNAEVAAAIFRLEAAS